MFPSPNAGVSPDISAAKARARAVSGRYSFPVLLFRTLLPILLAASTGFILALWASTPMIGVSKASVPSMYCRIVISTPASM